MNYCYHFSYLCIYFPLSYNYSRTIHHLHIQLNLSTFLLFILSSSSSILGVVPPICIIMLLDNVKKFDSVLLFNR